ncbi:hypothetical protein GGF38_005290 [Coemansia sp. RSA 25]|nr:hypothetical protein GGF38_005290 [Coemansia sp. RSA 25]
MSLLHIEIVDERGKTSYVYTEKSNCTIDFLKTWLHNKYGHNKMQLDLLWIGADFPRESYDKMLQKRSSPNAYVLKRDDNSGMLVITFVMYLRVHLKLQYKNNAPIVRMNASLADTIAPHLVHKWFGHSVFLYLNQSQTHPIDVTRQLHKRLDIVIEDNCPHVLIENIYTVTLRSIVNR